MLKCPFWTLLVATLYYMLKPDHRSGVLEKKTMFWKLVGKGFLFFSFGANLTVSSGFVINGIAHRDFQCINDWKQYFEHLYRGQKHHTDKSDSVIDWGPHIKKYLTDEFRWGQLRISKTGHLQMQNIHKCITNNM